MRVVSVELKNFRNYDSLSLKFSDGINVLVGKNAQGKTNLLEAIYLVAIGRSPRTSKDRDLIKWGSDFAKVNVEITRIGGRKKIEVYLFNNQNKAIKINSFPISKIGELMGEFNCIYFSPDEMRLIKDSPDERRRFIDIHLSQFDKNYFYHLAKYNKVLQARNKLLKSGNESVIKDTISIWNEQLASIGAKLIFDRIKFLQKLSVHAKIVHGYLTSDSEVMDLEYVGMTGDSISDIKNKLQSEYDKNLAKDIHIGYTTVGPHRDDIKISANGIDLRSFGSQGQQRTGALSLKLAELEVFCENLGEYPVLLLDDVLSELDIDRQNKLLSFVEKMQTIITCTDFNFDIKSKKYIVDGGIVKNCV